MTGISLPTLAGIARLTNILIIGNHPNTGATPRNLEYTTPAGRMGIITDITFWMVGGTGYTRVGFDVRIAGGGLATRLFSRPTPTIGLTTEWTGRLWLAETDDLTSAPDGGGSTSDYRVLITGVEFDWVDVT